MGRLQIRTCEIAAGTLWQSRAVPAGASVSGKLLRSACSRWLPEQLHLCVPAGHQVLCITE